jgi:hypothetical protein
MVVFQLPLFNQQSFLSSLLQTNANVDTVAETASAKQSTFVSDFATSIHNPIPNSKQNQENLGQVAAIDKNGNVVFQNGNFPEAPQP